MKNYSRLGIGALVAAIILSIASPAQSQQTAYYVSPRGNDSNAGTEAQPFKTLTKARDMVRALNKNMAQDIVVYLRGGTYATDQSLVFDARDSGTNGHNIIYKSSPGEKAVISGGQSIAGWERDSGNVWKARTDIPDFRQLYVNGVRAARARGGPLPDAEIYGGDGYKTSDVNMATWGNQSDIEFIYDVVWERDICKVHHIAKGGSGAVVTMLQPYFTLARLKEGVRPTLPSYVENARELLDAPGEWYFDRTAHVVYYIPRAGEDVNSAEIVAPVVEKLLELKGSLDAPVRNIQFEGLTFCQASWLQPSQSGLVDLQANFVMRPQNLIARAGGFIANLHNEYIKSPSNVVLHAAKSIRFERCTFTQLGSGGIDLEYGSQDNIISGNKFYDVSGSAIQVGDVIDHHPRDPREIVKNNQIVNNYIHDVAIQYAAGVGIFGGYTEGTVIAHNEIRNLAYSGISVGWGWGEEDAGGDADHYYQPFVYKEPTPSRGLRCEYNHIHHVMLERNDGGGIYTIGNMPGSIIRGNVVHDNVGQPGGIYLDEGSGFIEVTGNIVYNVSRAMNYNNRAQNRIATCHEHDNYFDVKRMDRDFPKAVAEKAGLEPAYRDLLKPDEGGQVH
jgi:hypothetical protein